MHFYVGTVAAHLRPVLSAGLIVLKWIAVYMTTKFVVLKAFILHCSLILEKMTCAVSVIVMTVSIEPGARNNSVILCASLTVVRGTYCDRPWRDVVGSLASWLAVGHVRELWLNGASEACSYCWNTNRKPYHRNSVVPFWPPPTWDLGPIFVIRVSEARLTVLLRSLVRNCASLTDVHGNIFSVCSRFVEILYLRTTYVLK